MNLAHQNLKKILYFLSNKDSIISSLFLLDVLMVKLIFKLFLF